MDYCYTIVDSFQVKDKMVLVFDRKLDDKVLSSKYINVDGEEFQRVKSVGIVDFNAKRVGMIIVR